MVVAQVGGAVEVHASRHLQGVVDEAEGLQVGTAEVDAESEVRERLPPAAPARLLAPVVEQPVHIGLRHQLVVVGREARVASSAFQLCVESGVREVDLIVAEAGNLGAGIYERGTAVDVGAATFQLGVGRHGAQWQRGQEIVQAQAFGADVGVVGNFGLGADFGLHGGRAAALGKSAERGVAVAVGFQVACEAHLRQAHVVEGSASHAAHPVDVLRLEVVVDVGAQAGAVGQAAYGAAAVEVERAGQRGFDVVEGHIVEVAAPRTAHVEQLVGVGAVEALGQAFSGNTANVGFREVGVEREVQGSVASGLEGLEVDVRAALEARRWRSQVDARQADVLALSVVVHILKLQTHGQAGVGGVVGIIGVIRVIRFPRFPRFHRFSSFP